MGFGRSEIITKSGTGDFHGSANFLFRDAELNARNPFAATRPPYQQKDFNASLSGPLIRNRLSFNLDVRNNANELSDAIHATLPTGLVSEPVVMPNLTRSVNARGQWTLSPRNTIIFNVDYQRIANKNQGIGGFTLPERAWTRRAENSLYQARLTTVVSPKLVHEFRVGYRRDYSETDPFTNAISINVSDAFNAGGSQNQNINDNRSVEFGDVLMFSGVKWSFRTGA